jgi:UDP-glucuronate 4-epimerase
MAVVVTGAAGFIGYHVARRLADRKEVVLGLDTVDSGYDSELKRRRLGQLRSFPNFRLREVDVADAAALAAALDGIAVDKVVHLAAAAPGGDPAAARAALDADLAAHLNLLEFCRIAGGVETFVYASSGMLYGTANYLPSTEDGITDRPQSLQIAAKKAQEMVSTVYAHSTGLHQIGLRIFSAYGPWGRPDMVCWRFTDALLKGEPIHVFDQGNMRRDFVYIDDVVAAVVAAVDSPVPQGDMLHRIYNVGSGEAVMLLDLVGILERLLNRRARIELAPLPTGEIPVTQADPSALEAALGVRPKTKLVEGLRRFVEWFRLYHRSR